MRPLSLPPGMIRRFATAILSGLFILLLSAVLFQKLFNNSDPYKCEALRSHGGWVLSDDPGHGPSLQKWSPPGCLLHQYTGADLKICLGGSSCGSLLFVGDSAARQIFWSVAQKIDSTRAGAELASAAKHEDLIFAHGCHTLEFSWDPYFNRTHTRQRISATETGNYSNTATEVTRDRPPNVAALVSYGLWGLRYSGESFLEHFNDSLAKLTQLVTSSRQLNGSWTHHGLSSSLKAHPLFFMPIIVPDNSRLSAELSISMSLARIMELNDFLRNWTRESGAELLQSFSLLPENYPAAFKEDGIHVADDLVATQADIFLNLVCNKKPAMQRRPFNKTCCARYPNMKVGQFLILLTAIALCALSWLPTKAAIWKTRVGQKTLANFSNIRRMAFLGAALLCCFLSDRTAFFGKMEKVVDLRAFLVSFGSIFFLGLLTTVRNKCSHLAEHLDGQFLPREQTDEWKGWMQLVILLYHYFGLSKVLQVYKVVRLLVASYLFMTGYGHTIYFLKTGDFSVRRTGMVLFRTNLLSCLLAFTMDSTHGFYYFPALCSFWFLVVCLTLGVFPTKKLCKRSMIIRIVSSATTVNILFRVEGLSETVFSFLHTTLRLKVNVEEFRFRLLLDGFVVYVGIAVAVIYQTLGESRFAKTRPCISILGVRELTIQKIEIGVAITLMLNFFGLAWYLNDKYSYNKWHPVISPLPIMGYVIFRNSTPCRYHHIRIFAWLGRRSLETFVLQYHIWLAADTTGLLDLGIFRQKDGAVMNRIWDLGFWLNFTILTTLLIWISWAVSEATDNLTEALFPKLCTGETLGAASEKGARLRLASRENGSRGVGSSATFSLMGALLLLCICNWLWELEAGQAQRSI